MYIGAAIGIGISTLLYAGWIEYSVGNVWLRNGDFQPKQVLHYIKDSFTNPMLRERRYLDLNWLTFAIPGALTGICIEDIFF